MYDKAKKENKVLKGENTILQEQNHRWRQESKEFKTRYKISLSIIDSLKIALALQKSNNRILENNHNMLKESYDALMNNNNKLINENARKNRLLLEKLEEKEHMLAKLSNDLKIKEEELSKREKRINELENLIIEKENALANLKKNLLDALSGFKDKGLEIVQKDGKIYVMLDNKLLFSSGSYTVKEEGIKAIKKLGKF